MTNRQEVRIQTGALTKGTRHRRDKGLAPEDRRSRRGKQTLRGPRGQVWWKSVGAFLYRAKAKRRKAARVGQAGPQQRKPCIRRNAGGTGVGTEMKSVGSYPWRSAGFRAGGRRENERTDDRRPCRSRTGAQYPESSRKAALTPRETSAGRESAGGEGGGWRKRRIDWTGSQARKGSRSVRQEHIICGAMTWFHRSDETPKMPTRSVRCWRHAWIALWNETRFSMGDSARGPLGTLGS
jgi:hypothetical protein